MHARFDASRVRACVLRSIGTHRESQERQSGSRDPYALRQANRSRCADAEIAWTAGCRIRRSAEIA